MSTISITVVEAGDVTSAAGTNTNYTAVATGTGTIDDTNTQTEWVSAKHVDTGTNESVWNTDVRDFCNSALTYTLTSESYVTINLGGTTPVRIAFSPNLVWDRNYEVLRVHADINVDAVGTITLPSIMSNDEDCFFLRLYYQNSAGTWIPFSTCEWGYSVTNYTEYNVTEIDISPVDNDKDFSGVLQTYAMTHPRRRFRCSISGFLFPVAAGIQGIELRAKLADNATVASVQFKEATMACVMVRN